MGEVAEQQDPNALGAFESVRPELTALAYRMLGDRGRAEDVVQDAWLRWERRDEEVRVPRAYLIKIVTRLCLNELDSARARREESRADRLPEPVDLHDGGMGRLEELEHVSMAFLVVLAELAPAERAVFLLHEICDLAHDEIAPLVGRSSAACRKMLERARKKLAGARGMATASREEHEALLERFLGAIASGDQAALVQVLAADATLVTDGGASGRGAGGFRNLKKPLVGAEHVAAFVRATSGVVPLEVERRELNGRPAVVFRQGDAPYAALLLGVADGRIQRVFFHADLDRLGHIGARR